MEPMILTGITVEKILDEFCREKKIKSDDVQYEVIEQGKSGFLGFIGSRKAQIKVTSFGIKSEIRTFLETLLGKMNIEFVDIEESETEDSFNYHIVDSSEPGFLIGKEARFLNNMQYLVNRIFEDRKEAKRIYLDVDNYKERQAEQIVRRYEPVLDRVISNKKPYTLEPLDPNIRRVIHKYIESRPEISTLTIGDGKLKRIVVFPKGYDQTKIRKRSYSPSYRRNNTNSNTNSNPNHRSTNKKQSDDTTKNTATSTPSNNNSKPNNNPRNTRVTNKPAATPNTPKSTFKPRKKPYRKPKKQQDSDSE